VSPFTLTLAASLLFSSMARAGEVKGSQVSASVPKKMAKDTQSFYQDIDVTFHIHDSAGASASRLGSDGSVSVSEAAEVRGLDDATLQAITDATATALSAHFGALGWTVLPGEEAAAAKAFSKFEARMDPPVIEDHVKGDKSPVASRTFTPSGYFELYNPKKDAPLGELKQTLSQMKAIAELGAVSLLVKVDYTFVDFAAHGGVLLGQANVNMAPRLGMSLSITFGDSRANGSLSGSWSLDEPTGEVSELDSSSFALFGYGSSYKLMAVDVDPATIQTQVDELLQASLDELFAKASKSMGK